jgi:hypothetical protein
VKDFYKGMTVSCQTWGKEWATPQMKETMLELKELGVNSIAIHPYARISEDGTVRFRREVKYHIITPIQWSKELDVRFMLKPHLAYWGTDFGWRGDIKFDKPDEWKRFFRTYKNWMIFLAEITETYGADMFCVGTEYRQTIDYEAEWRDIIDTVRQIYTGKITYAANWDTYQKVSFWDALDFIGIQAYFPLVDSDMPSRPELTSAWLRIIEEMKPFAKRLDKKIIFTEIGYNMSPNTARSPWSSYTSRSNEASELQKRCLEVALKMNTTNETLAGIFLWKWFPETQLFRHHENFDLQRPAVKQLIRDIWYE